MLPVRMENGLIKLIFTLYDAADYSRLLSLYKILMYRINILSQSLIDP